VDRVGVRTPALSAGHKVITLSADRKKVALNAGHVVIALSAGRMHNAPSPAAISEMTYVQPAPS
jgi:hypothetical protein